MLKAYTDAYEATGDPLLLAHRWDQADQTAAVPFHKQHALNFNLSVYPVYLRYVGHEVMRKRFIEYADKTGSGEYTATVWRPFAILAGAYQITGNRKYLEQSANLLAEKLTLWLERGSTFAPCGDMFGMLFSFADYKKAGLTEKEIFDLHERKVREAMLKKKK